MTAALAIYALGVSLFAVWAEFERRRWFKSYREALRTYGNLAKPPGPTPHQKAAATRRAARIEAMRKHRLALEASMQRDAAQ